MNKLLIAGQIFKNYKEVCEWLGVKPSVNGGNTKIAHIKEFERYCKYHKEKNKYIVDEVYETPLDKVDGRVNNKGGNNNKYFDLMDNVIIDMLKKSNILDSQKTMFCENIPLFKMNEYNTYYNVSLDTMAKRYKTTSNLVKTYFDKMLNITKKCFLKSLNRLKINGVINYEIGLMTMNYYGNTEYISPNDKLFSKIKKFETEVLEEMKIVQYDKIMNKNINKEFKENMIIKLHDTSIRDRDNISLYWKVYNIEFAEDVEKNIDLNSIKSNTEELRKQLIINLHIAIEKHKVYDKTPYEKSKYTKDILYIDSKIWIDAEKLIDDKNLNFQSAYNNLNNTTDKEEDTNTNEDKEYPQWEMEEEINNSDKYYDEIIPF